jgi:hypothetical protein
MLYKMIDLKNFKKFILMAIIQKKYQMKIWDKNKKQRRKEKKRLMIEQIKEERKENSLLFDEI